MSCTRRWLDDFLSLPEEELIRHAQSQIKKGYIPVLFDQHRTTDWKPQHHKFSTVADRPFSDIVNKVRTEYYKNPARGLAYFCGGELICPTQTVGELYARHKTEHGFLIVTVMEESCFG